MDINIYINRVRNFLGFIRKKISLRFKFPVVFKKKLIYYLRDSNNNVLFKLSIQKSNFVVPDGFIRQSYNYYIREKIIGIKLGNIQKASCTQLFSWLQELYTGSRASRFISKNYKKSLTDTAILKNFLLKHLPTLQFLHSTRSSPTKFPTKTSPPLLKSSNPSGGHEDSKTPSMAITFGGIMWNAYSALGGSRLYLCTTTSPDTMGNTSVNYMNIDCTKNVIISTDVNICTLKAGCIFTMYLVPMLTAENDPSGIRYIGSLAEPMNPLLVDGLKKSNGIYDAEYGIGYRDAQSVSSDVNNQSSSPACIEIDLFELTLCNAQATTHGFINDPLTNEYIIDRFGSYQNAWGTIGSYGASGTYDQTNMFNKDTTNPPFGPGTMFKINTLETFNVKSSITINGTTLTMVTTITQMQLNGTLNTITLAPKSSIFTGTDGKFVPELSTMQLVSAIWLTQASDSNTTSTWLDGIDGQQIKSYAQDQKPAPTTSNKLTNVTFDNPESISYDYSYKMGYQTMAFSKEYGPVFARYQNVQIEQFNLFNGLTPCWSLDIAFRGMNLKPNTPASLLITYWHGFYGQTYGVAYAPKGSNILISDYKNVLLNPGLYYNTVSYGLNYGMDSSDHPTSDPMPSTNYFAELTGLGVTDNKQSINIKNGYGYGYSLQTGTNDDLKQMNSYQINYILTPDLITFTTLCS
jgi:hypothetical protein